MSYGRLLEPQRLQPTRRLRDRQTQTHRLRLRLRLRLRFTDPDSDSIWFDTMIFYQIYMLRSCFDLTACISSTFGNGCILSRFFFHFDSSNKFSLFIKTRWPVTCDVTGLNDQIASRRTTALAIQRQLSVCVCSSTSKDSVVPFFVCSTSGSRPLLLFVVDKLRITKLFGQ